MIGVMSKMFAGWDYYFGNPPSVNAQHTATRATFQQFQEYPANEVQGRGTLVTQDGVNAGKYWRITQPPQVYATHRGPTNNIVGGGTLAGYLASAPLIPNPNANNSGGIS